jgi:hypothetical protein
MGAKLAFPQWVQSRLTAHGLPVGLIDGKIGPVTTAALTKFQKREGLAQSGLADEATVAALRKDPARIEGDAIDRAAIKKPADAVAPTRRVWPRQADVRTFYGTPGANQTKIEIPFGMKLAWDKKKVVRAITVHKKVADSASRCFAKIAETYSAQERAALGIDIFGGSLNVRKMRGGNAYSMHSWGIAIDFDPERNQLKWGKDKARLAQADAVPFWEIWEAEGWLSLGRARNMDWMHIQAARL